MLSPPNEDDATIIEESIREPDRFAAIFDRHAVHIRDYLARRLGRQVADDVLAETFLQAFRQRDRYDTARPEARPWLYGIATNLARQHQRAEIRAYRLRAGAVPDPNPEGHADRVAAQVTAAAMRRCLAAALEQLSVTEREVLLLIAWEDLSYDEVARALDIPIGTVRSRLYRARQHVRGALTKEPVTNG